MLLLLFVCVWLERLVNVGFEWRSVCCSCVDVWRLRIYHVCVAVRLVNCHFDSWLWSWYSIFAAFVRLGHRALPPPTGHIYINVYIYERVWVCMCLCDLIKCFFHCISVSISNFCNLTNTATKSHAHLNLVYISQLVVCCLFDVFGYDFAEGNVLAKGSSLGVLMFLCV